MTRFYSGEVLGLEGSRITAFFVPYHFERVVDATAPVYDLFYLSVLDHVALLGIFHVQDGPSLPEGSFRYVSFGFRVLLVFL